MNIFFLICFILVMFWAWNADNEIAFNKDNISKDDVKNYPKKIRKLSKKIEKQRLEEENQKIIFNFVGDVYQQSKLSKKKKKNLPWKDKIQCEILGKVFILDGKTYCFGDCDFDKNGVLGFRIMSLPNSWFIWIFFGKIKKTKYFFHDLTDSQLRNIVITDITVEEYIYGEKKEYY